MVRKTVYWCIGSQIIQTNPLIVRLCFTLGSSHLLFHIFVLLVPSTHRSVVAFQALPYMSPPQRSLPEHLVKSRFLIPCYLLIWHPLFLFLYFILFFGKLWYNYNLQLYIFVSRIFSFILTGLSDQKCVISF